MQHGSTWPPEANMWQDHLQSWDQGMYEATSPYAAATMYEVMEGEDRATCDHLQSWDQGEQEAKSQPHIASGSRT
eukprot:3760560-Pyramimonas_sp.AAC.1